MRMPSSVHPFSFETRIVAVTVALLISMMPGLCIASPPETLSPHVTVVRGAVNGVAIERAGHRLVVYGDPERSWETAELVLFTHSRRDVAWAGRALVENGAEAVVPAGEADFLVAGAADQGESNRHQLRPGGVLWTAERIDETALANRRSLNVALLGALSVHLPIPEADWLEAIRAALAPKLHDANLQAFELGRSTARSGKV